MNIVITGASRGIGYDTALKLSESKQNRIIAIARNNEKLQRLSDSSEHKNISIIVGDINKLVKSPEELLKSISFSLDKLDILINNAAHMVSAPFQELSETDTDELVTTNFTSPLKTIKALLPLMGEGSHVVNIGSMSGFQGSSKYPGLSVYSATKAAISSLTECLAAEYRERKISFNCLSFGAVQTEMLGQAFPGYKAPISSSDMADFVAWFCCNGQKYFNGKVLPVSLSNP